MSGFLLITEERLWDLVRDAYEDGRSAERNEAPMPEDWMHTVWLESRARKQVLRWVEQQKKGPVA